MPDFTSLLGGAGMAAGGPIGWGLAGLSALGGLGGLFMHNNPEEEYRKQLEMQRQELARYYSQYLSPQALNSGTMQNYQSWMQSPAYSAGLNNMIRQLSMVPQTQGMYGAGNVMGSRGALRNLSFSPALMGYQLQGWGNAQNTYMNAINSLQGFRNGGQMNQSNFPQLYGSLLGGLSNAAALWAPKR